MILEGRILLFNNVSKNGDIFSKDCKIDIPEKVPLTWNFNHEKVIGFANVTKDDKGLIAKAETFSNEMIGVEDLSSIFEDGKFGAGGFYTNVKMHNNGSSIVVNEAKLREVALVSDPVNEEYSFEIVEEKRWLMMKGVWFMKISRRVKGRWKEWVIYTLKQDCRLLKT